MTFVKPNVVVSQRFPIPVGAVGLVYDDTEVEEAETDVNDEDAVGGLDTPSTMSVITQVPRFADDGTLVVDVVLEVDDIPGVTKYDVRVSKK